MHNGQPQIITLANLQNLLPMQQQVQQLTQNQQNQGIKTITSNGTTIQPIFSVQGLPGQFIQVDNSLKNSMFLAFPSLSYCFIIAK